MKKEYRPRVKLTRVRYLELLLILNVAPILLLKGRIYLPQKRPGSEMATVGGGGAGKNSKTNLPAATFEAFKQPVGGNENIRLAPCMVEWHAAAVVGQNFKSDVPLVRPT